MGVKDLIDVGEIEGRLSSISHKIDRVDDKVDDVARRVKNTEEALEEARAELKALSESLNRMVEDQRKNASLQRAITELIRVRQEIDQKYGNYMTIRRTMVGVLQASDLALVKKTTISRVSEELMISTPDYWLAPCLVAVAAWISNDRELAERAITEALKRDEEKTALAMALICRRNGRTETGYEWLSLYFTKQNSASFTEDSFTYVDAYVNGVFGPDEKQTCQGFVSKWIEEVKGTDSDFEESQVARWQEYCMRFSKNTREEYPDLAEAVPEYGRIDACVGRINAVPEIRKNFLGIKEAFVDKESMQRAIDKELIRLICNYDKAEFASRKEEEYLALVKYFRGDEDRAREEMNAREARRTQHKLDFIAQMSSAITSGEETSPSKRRTAMAFLGNYINQGVNRYVGEKRAEFPEHITVKVGKWSRDSRDGSEFEQLAAEYTRDMESARDEALLAASTSKPNTLLGCGITSFVLAAVLAVMGLYPFAGVSATLGIILMMTRRSALRNADQNAEKIQETFDRQIAEGKEKMRKILTQWAEAKQIVEDFDKDSTTNIVA